MWPSCTATFPPMQPWCIVIDECQNLAERACGAQKSQRAKLAERLATCTEILILLLARPALHLRIVIKSKSIGRAAYN